MNWSNYERKDLVKELGHNFQNADHFVKEMKEEDIGSFLSNLATDILTKLNGFTIQENNGSNYIFNLKEYGNKVIYRKGEANFTAIKRVGEKTEWQLTVGPFYEKYEVDLFNIANSLIYHEWYGHIIKGWDDDNKQHYKCYKAAMQSDFYNKTTRFYQNSIEDAYKTYLEKELNQ